MFFRKSFNNFRIDLIFSIFQMIFHVLIENNSNLKYMYLKSFIIFSVVQMNSRVFIEDDYNLNFMYLKKVL